MRFPIAFDVVRQGARDIPSVVHPLTGSWEFPTFPSGCARNIPSVVHPLPGETEYPTFLSVIFGAYILRGNGIPPDGNGRCTSNGKGSGEIDREAIENARDVKKLDIAVLGLSKRVYNKPQERGIRTIGELITKLEYGLKKVRGIGDAAYEEIVRQVRKAEIL